MVYVFLPSFLRFFRWKSERKLNTFTFTFTPSRPAVTVTIVAHKDGCQFHHRAKPDPCLLTILLKANYTARSIENQLPVGVWMLLAGYRRWDWDFFPKSYFPLPGQHAVPRPFGTGTHHGNMIEYKLRFFSSYFPPPLPRRAGMRRGVLVAWLLTAWCQCLALCAEFPTTSDRSVDRSVNETPMWHTGNISI